ncbi:Uncharacterised protein [Neisseria meningitidis]|nr:Uncharacterised protein [Neisseria meningitidis]
MKMCQKYYSGLTKTSTALPYYQVNRFRTVSIVLCVGALVLIFVNPLYLVLIFVNPL